ncbi:MAG: hypothetical protein ABI634_10955 [Acidobacteriota bacterium]
MTDRTRIFFPPLLFLALTVIHTWPIASSPARLSLNHNADAQLCEWTLSWIAHTLPAHPSSLFDGNIFAPEPHTLTYTDPMLVPALVAAPVRWAGGSPVLAFNLAMLAGLTLTAWATWWGARRWTGSDSAALVAGALAAYNSHLLTRLPHIVAAYAWTIPVSLVLVDRLLDEFRRRDLILFGVVVTATAVTSPYWLAQLAIVAGIGVAIGAWRRQWRAALSIAAAAMAGLAAASPILLPYARFAATGVSRPLSSVEQFSATLSGYLSSVSHLHAGWTRVFYRDDVNVWFAGVTAIVLAGAGLVSLLRRADTRRRGLMLIVVAAAGIVLSLGPATMIYRWLYEWLLPLRGLRAAARFGYLYLVVVAYAAAIGTAALQRRARGPRAAGLIAALVLIAVTIEAWSGPVKTVPFDGVPAIYQQIANAPDPVRLAELPFYPAEGIFMNGEYVLNATAHWRPLMNGYSGYIPDSYRDASNRLWYFPESRAMDALLDTGATHVMVHLEKFTPQEIADIDRVLRGSTRLTLLASDTMGHRLYKVLGSEVLVPGF